MKNFGLYIHIPFCKQRCYYCNFHMSTNLSLRNQMIDCIKKEIFLKSSLYKNCKISTIYFGGGTPSILPIEDLESIFNSIYENFEVEKDIEITLEANPDDFILEKFINLRKLGVNRLSIGIQSFDDNVLKFINRAHDKICAENSIKIAKEAGFENLSLDIIFAMINSSFDILKKDLEKMVSFSPSHISCYSLMIKENTVFDLWVREKKIKEVEEQDAIDQYLYICEFLEKNGYEHYEISNFCKPNKESKHNSSYWDQEKGYIGIGPSAHSFDGKSRSSNISQNMAYINSIKENIIPETIEILSDKNIINEYIMTSFRTKKGLDTIKLFEKYSYQIESKEKIIDQFIKIKYLERDCQNINLTKVGMLFADEIAKIFFV